MMVPTMIIVDVSHRKGRMMLPIGWPFQHVLDPDLTLTLVVVVPNI